MFQLSHDRNTGMPSYICDIKTSAYCSGQPHWGRLLKLHGSVNWLYCPGCHRLDIGWSRKQQATRGVGQVLFGEPLLNEQFTRTTRKQCRDCGAERRHILITPTYRKDYRNPHVARVWYEAERALQEANRVIFVGYSLPEDDVEVVYLLKRSLADLDPSVITVVEKDQQGRELKTHPVGRRYRALFGDAVDFRTEGFSEWIQGHQQHNWSPLNPGLPRPV
jgi:hypothetical protein